MTDDQIRFLLMAFALPAAIGVAAGVAVRLVAAEGWTRLALAAGPLAIGAAFLAAHIVIVGGPPRWPPIGSESRLFLLAAGATLLLAGVAATGRPAAAWSMLVLAALAVPIAIMWPDVRGALTSGSRLGRDDLVFLAGGALAALLIAFPVVRTERDGYARGAAIILAGLCAASGAALAASGTMKLAQFAWALCAATIGLGLLVPRRDSGVAARLGPAGLGLPAALLAAILLTGARYAELPRAAAAALALAAAASLLGAIVPKVGPGWRIHARVALAAAVAAGGVATALLLVERNAYPY